MQRLLIGLRLLWRDWRGGELGLLLGALTISVTIVVGIGLFVDRIHKAILVESNEFLAADRVVRSNKALPDAFKSLAQEYGLRQADVLHFPTMAFAGDEMQLAAVKAVSETYPLIGQLRLAREQEFLVSNGPPPGEVWVEPRLLKLLTLQLGDELNIGNTALRITSLVLREPDSGFSVIAYGPRVLMNTADLAAANVLQVGSRVQYNLLVQGDASALQKYVTTLTPQLSKSQKILGVRDSQPTLAQALERAESFLLLAGSMGVVLAGIAIAIAARRYTERHYDYVAILRSLGSTAREVLGFYFTHLGSLTLLAVVLGSAFGWLAQAAAFAAVRDVLSVDLPEPGARPFIMGAATAIISCVAFAVPSLLHLQGVTPMRVLRRDLGAPSFNGRLVFAAGIVGLLAIVLLYTRSLQLTLLLSTAVLFAAGLVFVVIWGVLRRLRVTGVSGANPTALAFAAIRRRAAHSALQVFVFSLALMLAFILAITRSSLLEEWRMQMPVDTPNHFLLNISDDQVDGIRESLVQADIRHSGLSPMVRGRLTHIKAVPVTEYEYPEEDAEFSADNERFMTWAEALPEDNILVAGEWWGADDVGVASIESEWAERLGITVGDQLRFTVADRELTVTVTSLRALDWEQMRPNFYVLMSPATLRNFPASYMTSFYLPEQRKVFLQQLLKQFPTIGIVDVDAVVQQVRGIIDRVSLAVELVLGLILLAGVVVLFASVQTSLDERYQEHAVLKTLGARSSLLSKSLFAEFAMLGAMAGLFAAIGSEAITWALQHWVMKIETTLHWQVLVLGPIVGAGLVACLGYSISARSVRATPMEVLRRAA